MKRNTILFGFLMMIIGVITSVSLLILQKTTDVNLVENLKVEFVGENGSGVLNVKENNIVLNIEDDKKELFIDELSYVIQPESHLKNGDKVHVEVIYSQELANNFRLNIIENKKQFVVKGLKKSDRELNQAGANTNWLQGNSSNKKELKEKEFLFKDYGIESVTFSYAEEYGVNSSQEYKVVPIVKDEKTIGYKCVFKNE